MLTRCSICYQAWSQQVEKCLQKYTGNYFNVTECGTRLGDDSTVTNI